MPTLPSPIRPRRGELNENNVGRALVICVAGSAEDRIKLGALVARNANVLLVSSPDDVPALLDLASNSAHTDSVVVLPQLRLDSDRHVATWFGREVALTPLEFDLLACLLENPGRMWAFEDLHERVWRTPYLGSRFDIHSLVKRLRTKLGHLDATVVIEAVRGVGFRLVLPARAA